MLTRRLNPWSMFNEFQSELNTLFDDFGFVTPLRRPGFPAINVWEDNDAVMAEAEVPGLKLDDLEIFVVGDELTIKGKREPQNGENTVYHRRERGTGMFTRVITLPVEVDANKVEASLANGVLTIRMPKAESARARKIKVKAG